MKATQAERFARSFQSLVARNPGAACLTLPILQALGVIEAVNRFCPSGHVASHGQVTQLLVVNRLQAPRPLYKVGAWLEQSALPAEGGPCPPKAGLARRKRALAPALGIQPEQAHDTRLGETLDALYPHHQALWQEVIRTAVQRYHLPLDWLHYDITSTYFEGLYTESELLHFGSSRDQRPDSKQLNLGLNVTAQGLPLAFRVLVGNTADRTTPAEGRATPQENLEAVRRLLSDAQSTEMTIVHDRAMARRRSGDGDAGDAGLV